MSAYTEDDVQVLYDFATSTFRQDDDLREALEQGLASVATGIAARVLREAADRAEELTGTKADWLYTLAELTAAADR